MVRAALRRAGQPKEAGRRRLVHLDRDRPLVDAAQADPARFEALYRKYLAQVYSFAFYELGDHHDAEDATERTFLAALASLHRFEERARPDDGEGASLAVEHREDDVVLVLGGEVPQPQAAAPLGDGDRLG